MANKTAPVGNVHMFRPNIHCIRWNCPSCGSEMIYIPGGRGADESGATYKPAHTECLRCGYVNNYE